MRIISGKFKGRIIKMPKAIRPTQQKIRKAIFDVLGDFIKGSSFLELFAGSGAVGIEAISYGAEEVTFVENSRSCASCLENNLVFLQVNNYRMLFSEAVQAIKILANQGKKFDIIFFDPPYYQQLAPRLGSTVLTTSRLGLATINNQGSLAKKTLLTLGGCDILNLDGLVIAQHHKKDLLPPEAGFLRLLRQKSYGDNILSFYQKVAE